MRERVNNVINKYTNMNPELYQINDIIINNVNSYKRRFELYKNVCKGKLEFDNDVYFDIKSSVVSKISVLSHNLEKYLKIKINRYRRQGLETSHISEMIITFITRLHHMTYEHYIEQTMPMVERLIIRKLYKSYDLIKTLDDIDLTLHMGAHETGKAHMHYSGDEDEELLLVFDQF